MFNVCFLKAFCGKYIMQVVCMSSVCFMYFIFFYSIFQNTLLKKFIHFHPEFQSPTSLRKLGNKMENRYKQEVRISSLP